jgi:hypothetical protein
LESSQDVWIRSKAKCADLSSTATILEESFFSTHRSSCIAVISSFLFFDPSKTKATYWIYDPVENTELASFITQPGDADNSQVRETEDQAARI